MASFCILQRLISFNKVMQRNTIKAGDKLTFQWRPGYRGALRDGETVIVLSVEEECSP